MSTPKTVTKVLSKHGSTSIEYTSEVDQANYYIYELSRAALRDVSKFITKEFKNSFYNHFKKISGDAGKATKYKVLSSKNTKYPRTMIGLKTGQVDGFYAYFQEFGSSKTDRLGLLQQAVQDNIPTIVEIESQYLSGLSGEAERLKSLVDDDTEYEGDADE